MEATTDQHPVLLFDGVCVLCHRSIQFIIKHDPGKIFQFAPLQSDKARAIMSRFEISPDSVMNEGDGSPLTTVILVEGDSYKTHSAAALRVLKRLGFPWNLLYIFIIVPRFLRDPVYHWIARHRYRWFGKYDKCIVPDKDVKDRFLDYEIP